MKPVRPDPPVMHSNNPDTSLSEEEKAFVERLSMAIIAIAERMAGEERNARMKTPSKP